MEKDKEGNFSIFRWLLGFIIPFVLDIISIPIITAINNSSNIFQGIQPIWLRYVFPIVLISMVSLLISYIIEKRKSYLYYEYGVFWNYKFQPFCPSCKPNQKGFLKPISTNSRVLKCPQCDKLHELIGNNSVLYTYESVLNHLKYNMPLEEYTAKELAEKAEADKLEKQEKARRRY